jgi:hypothetical protein
MRPRLVSGSLLALSLAFALGCGGGGGGGAGNTKPLEQTKTVPARGIVTYKGKPLDNAAVTFMPLDDGKTVPARGKTDSVGSFVLSTYGDKDGAPVGKYKVLVSVNTAVEVEPGVLAPEPEGGFKSPIPVKYNNVKTTDILVEVKDGDPNDFKIDLK